VWESCQLGSQELHTFWEYQPKFDFDMDSPFVEVFVLVHGNLTHAMHASKILSERL
jgi:hypothetical protein